MNKFCLLPWPSTEKSEFKIYLTILVAMKGCKLSKLLMNHFMNKNAYSSGKPGLVCMEHICYQKGQRHYYVMLVLMGFKI